MYLSSEEDRFWEPCAQSSRIALQSLLLRRYKNNYVFAISFYEQYWINLAVLRKIETLVGLLRSWFTGFRIKDQKFEQQFLVFYKQTDTISIDLEKIRRIYRSRFST